MKRWTVPWSLAVAVCAVLAVAPMSAQVVDEPLETPASYVEPNLVPYTPPACTGIFPDVPCSNQFATWIEQLYRDRITTGCGGGLYCPDSYVTRGQMAAFLERMARGTERWKPNVVEVWQVFNSDGTPNATASGTALRDALASIPTSGAFAPSTSNRYVIRIGPGRYNLGSAQFTLPGYVSLEGAGMYATELWINQATPNTFQTVGTSMITDLQMTRNDGDDYSRAITVNGGTLTLQRVYMLASSGTSVVACVSVYDGGLVMRDSKCVSTGPGASVAYGVFVFSGHTAELDHCDIAADESPVTTYGTARLAFNRLMGTLYKFGSGSFVCFQNFDWSSFAAKSCP